MLATSMATRRKRGDLPQTPSRTQWWEAAHAQTTRAAGKRLDGRTEKGLRIQERFRERIIKAYIDLIRRGNPNPTALQTARRARLSLRVIFKRFDGMPRLRRAALPRIYFDLQKDFPQNPNYSLPAENRIAAFVRQQMRLLEKAAPFRRAADLTEASDPIVAGLMKQVRAGTVKDIERALGPALDPLSRGQRRELLLALHTVCTWPSWQTLRTIHDLSHENARKIMTRAAVAVLHDSLEGIGLRQLKRSGNGRKIK